MKRLLTAALLIPFFLYIVLAAHQIVFLVVLAAVSVLCFYEYCGLAVRHLKANWDLQRSPLSYAGGLVLLVLPGQEMGFLCVLAILLMVQSLRADDLRHSLPTSALLMLGIIYTFGAWRCGAALRLMSPYWLLFALAINWVGDTCAYYFGRMFGRHKLAPVISPGKSWEGAIASLIGTAALGTLYLHYFVPDTPLPQALLLSVAANVAGQVGDLCESAFKRGAGVKDSGNLLPGHGGWLDRVDSSLFSVPVVYWLVQQRWLIH